MDNELLKQDFYEYVNGGWLKTAVIPADKPATGGFQDLVDGIDKLMIAEFEAMVADPTTVPAGRMQDAVAFYELARDYATRDHLGVAPILPILQKIETLESFADLDTQLTDWLLEGLPLPFSFSVESDMKNTKINILHAGAADTILPDKTYYDPDNQQGPQLLQVFAEMTNALLEKFGKTPEEAAAIVANALAFDRLIVPHVRSSEESADYSKEYNPRTFAEVKAYSSQLNLGRLLQELVHDRPQQINVIQPAYFEALDQLLIPDHFSLLKDWMLVEVVNSYTGILSEDLRQLGGTYSRTLSGATEAMNQTKAAYYMTAARFSQVVGDYYGKKYFGEKARNDVRQMVEKMIKIYQDRLENNTWLSAATREKAIKKLSTLGIHVGYPDTIPAYYDRFITKTKAQGGTLVENARRFSRIVREDNFSRYGKEMDRNEWEMSAATVNAYYHPFKNVIVFPAAILQAPFYSLTQSSSANFGGIGGVIAHEISHAFDNNGAKFDEYGNMNNWWTEADLAHFDQLAQAMIAQFDGIPYAGGKVNGTLTVSENIADAGGLSCALEAAQQEADADLEDFFINWAKIWRTKAREQYLQLLLAIDVHAPAKLRANIQVQNLPEFYETFDIKAGDGMYLPPEKRVHIW